MMLRRPSRLGLRGAVGAHRGYHRGKKRRIYRREPVEFLSHVDPRDRSLEVWRLVEGRRREVDTFEGAAIAHTPPFEGVALALVTIGGAG